MACRQRALNRVDKHTKAQYQADRPSIPSPLVNTAMVQAHAKKIINPWTPWMMFFVRPELIEGRASFMIAESEGIRRVVPDKEEGFLQEETGWGNRADGNEACGDPW